MRFAMLPRLARRGLLRPALGLVAGALLTARAAVACEPAAAPAARLLAEPLPPGVARHEFGGLAMLPYLALWHLHRPAPLPAAPDRVAVLAAKGHPLLLLAYRRGPCVLAVLPVPRDEVWAALRRMVGPVA